MLHPYGKAAKAWTQRQPQAGIPQRAAIRGPISWGAFGGSKPIEDTNFPEQHFQSSSKTA